MIDTPSPSRNEGLIATKAGSTISVMYGTFTEHTFVKCETTSGIYDIVI